jgi:hypothetical protein
MYKKEGTEELKMAQTTKIVTPEQKNIPDIPLDQPVHALSAQLKEKLGIPQSNENA